MKKMFYIFYAGLVCCGAATAITSCSDDTYGRAQQRHSSLRMKKVSALITILP